MEYKMAQLGSPAYEMLLSLHRAAWPPATPLLVRPPSISPPLVPIRRRVSSRSSGRMEGPASPSPPFDSAAFESDRLRLDAEARASMAAAAAAELDNGAVDPKAWKWRIRKRVWDLMEAEGIARNPRPVHHRIPNFDGAPAAADLLGGLDAFQKAQCVKVNPDSPQKHVRFLTLTGWKKLLTPQPRLRTGFFSVLDSRMLPPGRINEGCTSVGVAKYGKPVDLDEKIKVDLIVIGSVAVDPRTGARLGKGEGFAELEYGMLRYMGAIDDSTLVVTSVHDKQLVDDIPVDKLLIHDVPVDIICTPTQVIFYQHLNSQTSRNLLGKIVSRETWTDPNTQRTKEANRARDWTGASLWTV